MSNMCSAKENAFADWPANGSLLGLHRVMDSPPSSSRLIYADIVGIAIIWVGCGGGESYVSMSFIA